MSDVTPNWELPEIAASDSAKEVTHNEALRILDSTGGRVLSIEDVEPGAPSDGDVHIVGTTDSLSGDYNGYDNYLAAYSSTAWIFILPPVGYEVYNIEDNTRYRFLGESDGWEVARTYDVECEVVGTPGDGVIVRKISMVRAVTFPQDFAGSQADSGTDASDSGGADFSIQKNGVEFGTLNFDGSSWVFSTDTGGMTFAAGDYLSIVTPSPVDSTLADVSITLVGTREE